MVITVALSEAQPRRGDGLALKVAVIVRRPVGVAEQEIAGIC